MNSKFAASVSSNLTAGTQLKWPPDFYGLFLVAFGVHRPQNSGLPFRFALLFADSERYDSGVTGTLNTQAMTLSGAPETAGESMSDELARILLIVKFDPVGESRANKLPANACEGALSADKQAEIDAHLRVGRIMAGLRLRDRKTLGRKA